MSFDPKTLNPELAEEGVWFDVLNYDGDPIYDGTEKVQIKLRGSQSAEVKAVDRQSQVAGIKSMRKGSDAAVEKMVERGERNAFEVAVAATVDWKHIGLDGADVECTPENVRKVYKAANWLAVQMSNNVYDDKRFIKGSATN